MASNEDPAFRKLLEADKRAERRILLGELISLAMTAVVVLWLVILFRGP